MEDDAIFWERLGDMPDIEAVAELRLRRTRAIEEKEECEEYMAGRSGAARADAVSRQLGINKLLTKINEELKTRNLRMDNASWRNAVRTVLGDEAYEQCREWIMINGH